ncbi:hypothetical protein GCM10028807_49970 [Spirosoma daeguense]
MSREILGVLFLVIAVAVVLWRKGAKTLRWPIKGTLRISSPFGARVAPTVGASTYHNGIDIAVGEGTTVYAPASGNVVSISTSAAGGKQLTIRHTNGMVSGYAHLSNYAVVIGESVTQGQVIAYSGKTGNVTGPHLHFSLRDETGQYVNPLAYLPTA